MRNAVAFLQNKAEDERRAGNQKLSKDFDKCADEIARLTKQCDLAQANADAVYARLMPEVERLRKISAQRKHKRSVVATARNRLAKGVDHWKSEAGRLRAALDQLLNDKSTTYAVRANRAREVLGTDQQNVTGGEK